jgi:putative DNA primase/helicase
MVSRPDLLDRALVVELPAITEGRRRTKEEVWQALEDDRPRLLGALLDVVASGLRNLPTTRLAELPRMADFTRWVEACAPALGWQPGAFTAALFQRRDDADAQALGQWSVYPYLLRVLGDLPVFEGTVAELLKVLNALRRSEGDYDLGDWPRTPKALGGELRRYAPNLARVGVELRHLGRSRDGSRIRLASRSTSPESSAAPGQAAA